jgi:DNA-directed RNA polymerase subunit beta'
MIDFRSPRERTGSSFDYIQVRIAAPEEIRGPKDPKERERLEMQGQRAWWSWGEVTKPETINYRSFKPERDGLFCEKIFGPVKDWECHCGKYKRIRYRGVICDRCGVEVTLSKVRRERMGHIELAVPVAHIWFFKTLPSPMGNLLDITLRDLERIIYYTNYVVIDPGHQEVQEHQLLDEDEFLQLRQKAREAGDGAFKADIGAPAVRSLLERLDVDKTSERLRGEVAVETSQHRKKQLLKRLKVVDAFRNSADEGDVRNNPAWMILDVVPVIPPDLRPLVPLDGGRFATSDLNDLYRRVINRNNRLQKLIQHRAPEVILRNEKRMLQEAVDALFDNGRRSKAIRGRGKRPLKSLSDMLKGKQGRFRQNLLGKRVDYSGRSVIVVGPELRLHQCGLPKAMAVELFKPFIIHKLVEKGIAETVKRAKKIVERESPEVYEILEEIIQDHPVMLNRAPTLHRLGIQAFEPVLVEGKAIRIHPLVCAAFNADFDGDQMAVHVPLSFEAQLECRLLMISSNNILKPSDGRPVAEPSQDMVLGCYFLTKEPADFKEKVKTGTAFGDIAEVETALLHRKVGYHTPIRFRWLDEAGEPQWIDTTVGRVLFNAILPKRLQFRNEVMKKKTLSNLVFESFRNLGLTTTVEFLDRLKAFGFGSATLGGISIGIEDLHIPDAKAKLIGAAEERVERFQRAYSTGSITNGERYNRVIDAWTHANNDIADEMVKAMGVSKGGFNPVFMMFDSGSRGSRDQIRQLAGMRGLMAKPQKKLTGGIGEIIESPIRSNFREGLSVLEYFISTHGARKGLADTALKTADAGYLTRRLVDVAQDVTITEEDCGTVLGLEMSALKEGEDIVEPLAERIVGCVAADDVFDPHELDDHGDPRVLVAAGALVDEATSQAIEDSGIETVRIRSVLTCESRRGLCRMCYGRNLATMDMVDIGEAVGILAAQSIGEPGTQLTLRTFHIGGTAARIAEVTDRRSKLDGRVEYGERLQHVKTPDGRMVITKHDGELVLKDEGGRVRSRFQVPLGAELRTQDGQVIKRGDPIFTWDPYTTPIIADVTGIVRFRDIVEDETIREELDELTGLRQRVIVEDREKKLHPHIEIVHEKGGKEKKVRDFVVPEGAQLTVEDGENVFAGQVLAKISREAYRTRDITGGLPRVAELFEARRPKDPATISEIDGIVRFGEIKRGKREIFVHHVRVLKDGTWSTDESAEPVLYEVPAGKHLRVHEGDRVRAGDRLTEGPVNPHDILQIRGPRAVQEYLLNEVQEVYRLQGVKINDKHIGVIVRQMLQKVRVQEPADSDFLEGEHVDRNVFREENNRIVKKGGAPSSAEPLLLGITKASLTTQSFISAASFQETTRVLTDAAIRGARDDLLGLKENIIIGHLIPAGTGIYRYHEIDVTPPEGFEPPPPPVEPLMAAAVVPELAHVLEE